MTPAPSVASRWQASTVGSRPGAAAVAMSIVSAPSRCATVTVVPVSSGGTE
jgi:hypothetical protein